jgi:hypothetical protein
MFREHAEDAKGQLSLGSLSTNSDYPAQACISQRVATRLALLPLAWAGLVVSIIQVVSESLAGTTFARV